MTTTRRTTDGVRRAIVAWALMLLAAGAGAEAQPRFDAPINDGWRFSRENAPGAEAPAYSDAHWEAVTLPHSWNGRDGQDGGNDYYRGTGWYRRSLDIDPAYRGKRLYLKFDGASTTASVFVNGRLAGAHRGGFSAFCFDVTALVDTAGSNSIAVKVNNARDTTIPPLRGDFTQFGGLYRGVHLLAVDPLSVSPVDDASPGVYVRQKEVDRSRAELEVASVIRNASEKPRRATVRCTILDERGEVVEREDSKVTIGSGASATVVHAMTIDSPRLWDGLKDPHRYRAVVEVLDGKTVLDRVTEPFGARYFSVDAEKGFFLNGRPYPLNGVNRHQDRENKGWALSAADHAEDYALIADMGCTAVRLAHYQQAKEFYSLCDSGGMVVWAELGLVDHVDASPEFAASCNSQLTELIKQNFNHPSIVFWSVFNELMPDSNRPLYSKIVTGLDSIARALDPSRLTAMASRSRYGGDEPINTVTDVIGYNVYRGWYEGMPGDFGAFMDTLHARHPRLRLCVSEYGAGAGLAQHEIPPRKPKTKGPWHPQEWQSEFHEVTWMAMAQRPYIWGTFVWNMFDFASDGRSEGELPGRNDKGLVSFDRKTKKDAFYWYRANWSTGPMVHIASRGFTPRAPGQTLVKVYSNCDSVSLSVNGTPAGTAARNGRLFSWDNVDLATGENRIEAVGYRDGAALKDSCVWVGRIDTLTGDASR